jgi:hypothetical protein
MYFDEFIMPSTGTRLPGPLAVKKNRDLMLFCHSYISFTQLSPGIYKFRYRTPLT